MRTYGQGSLATFDIFLYEYQGGSLVDPDGYATSTEPTVEIQDPYRNTVISAQVASRVSEGYYKIQITLPNTAEVGVWRAVWYFTINGNVPEEENRIEEFKIIPAGQIAYDTNTLINDLRIRLKDTHPDERKRKWTDTELYVFLENGLWNINVTPPGQSYFLIDYTPLWSDSVPQWKNTIIEGAMIHALIAQGIFEVGKEFSYSDNGISITIDRSSKYQTWTNTLLTNYENKLALIKKQYWMDSTKPQLILTSELMARFSALSPTAFRFR